MPSPPRLQFDTRYHIFNRGNNKENLFKEKRNYYYFLKLYLHHISPVAHTFAYSLLKNHFHLAVQTKTEEQILSAYRQLNIRKAPDPSRAFSNFFNAYAKAINKAYDRTGSLLQNPFRRIPIDNDAYLQRLIVYIHQNAQKHGFVTDFRDWPFSSFDPAPGTLGDLPGRQMVLDVFGDRTTFYNAHRQRFWDAFDW